jgi:uncharacterized delta-60 repeat protein
MENFVRALLVGAATGWLVVLNTFAQSGSVDFSFNAGSSVDFEVFQAALQSNGKIIIGGAFGSPSPGLARLNTDGSPDGSFNAGTGVNPAFGYAQGVSSVYALAVQPDDKIFIGGTFNSYNGIERTNIARINADGTLDLTFDPGQGIGGIAPKVMAIALQSDGKVLIGGQFSSINGTNRLGIARLNANGSLDTSFNPGTGVSGSTATVYALAVQPDGTVLVAGEFTSINGTSINRIARLNTNGSVDGTFNPGAGANGTVSAVAVQTNGQILIGGNFTTVNNTNRNRIARLNADGGLDTSFNPTTGANSTVASVLPLSGGQLILGGNFTTINNTNRNRIARLNSDGTLDTSFNPGTGANNLVNALALQANGEVILAGYFTLVNGVARNFVSRLDMVGSLDSGFNPGGTLDALVNFVARQPDGKLIAGGTFTNINQTGRNRIARLNSDGSLDTGFDPGSGVDSANAIVYAVALQSDGKVLVGGNFSSVNGVTHSGLARLNPNGGLDSGYNPVLTSGFAIALAVQPDDKLLVGGSFSKVNGTNRANIARLNTDGSLDTSFNPGTGANAAVRSIVVRTNGGVIIGGSFTLYNGTNRGCIAGLNTDGSLDATFNVGTGLFSGSPTLADAFALQSDGKVLVGGNFETYNGAGAESLARVNPDGSLDTNFDTRTLNGGGFYTYSVASQPDGKVLMGGNFNEIKSIGRNSIARLNPDGSLDTTFDPGIGAMAPISPYVYSVVLQPNGEVVIGGGFTTVNRSGRWYVARLHGDAPLVNPNSTSNGVLTLHWAAIPGRTYRVQFTQDLGSTNWSDLLPDVVAVTNTASKTDPSASPQRFYRVALLP